MTRGWAATGATLLLAACAFSWLMLRNTDRPDVLKALAGCYHSVDRTRDIWFRVDPAGWLVIPNDRIRVSGYHDKNGDALSPDKELIFDRYNRSKIGFDTRNPLLVRASADHRSLVVIDDIGGGDVTFQRVFCVRY